MTLAPWAWPSLAATLLATACGLVVLVREHFSKVGWQHLFLAGSVALWQGCTTAVLNAASPESAAYWSRAGAVAAVLVPPMVFHFSYTMVWPRSGRIDAVTWVWVIAAALEVLLATTDWFVAGTSTFPWGAFPRYGPVGAAFCLMTVAVAVASATIYRHAMRSNPVGGIAWRRVRMLLWALAGGTPGVVDFLPAFGIDVFPIGGIFVALALVPNVYTTVRYRLVEITPALAAQQMINTMADGVLVIDRDCMVRLVNPAACELLGYGAGQLIDGLPPRPVAALVFGEGAPPRFPTAARPMVELKYRGPGEVTRTLQVGVSLIQEGGQMPLAAVVSLHDVTATRAAQEQIHKLAYFDALTGLPNRILLKERFPQTIALAERVGGNAAVLFLDLDRFKQVNDTLGHDAGDQLLKVVTERITACVRESDLVLRDADPAQVPTLARLGGDEFVLLLAPIERGEDAAKVCIRILQSMARPVRLGSGQEVNTGVSIGIALYPADGRDADTLMKKADQAMYQAKQAGRNNARFFDEALNDAAIERLGIETSLRRALGGCEFLLHYQPVVDAAGAVVALDAQVLWNHPQRGTLSEREFLDVADEAGLAVSLGDWALRTACAQAQAWRAGGLDVPPVMVTLGAALVERDALTGVVSDAVGPTGVAPEGLWLCVRRGSSRVEPVRQHRALAGLARQGIPVVLDDFDSGQVAIGDLIAQPARLVRLGGDYLNAAAGGGEAAVATRALVSLAHGLDMRVIATGIETPSAARFLFEAGCDYQIGAAHHPRLVAEDVPPLLRRTADGA